MDFFGDGFRDLADAPPKPETWELVFTCVVLFLMFAVLLMNWLSADSTLILALTAFMVTKILTVKEAIAGFSNESLLSILCLFVVAEGIGKTGALDWYMTKLLGKPKTVPSAQLRMMIPLCIVSTFINNTPIVVVMAPIILRWARNIGISKKQLLIPLSWSVMLGGTCSLIGTSTNLVVQGQLGSKYPDTPELSLFGLSKYGIPSAIAGMAYMLLVSPWLLPEAEAQGDDEPILLGARLTPWSPAAGRTVQRSGLRDSGGIFLVSVYRASTGNIHRAVSRDFVLNAGDILYFTGLVESFGDFCNEHGLEVVTHDMPANELSRQDTEKLSDGSAEHPVPSLLWQASDITRMVDLIRGTSEEVTVGPAQIAVTFDNNLVAVGVNHKDRPGLLLDISKGLLRLSMQVRHTEAAVVGDRSISVWRCEVIGDKDPDLEEIWSVLYALLNDDGGVEAIKQRGLRVIRAKVIKGSSLVGKTAAEVNFRQKYHASIVALKKGNKTAASPTTTKFSVDDILVLQVNDDSPLLIKPDEGFYDKKKLEEPIPTTSDVEASARSIILEVKAAWRDLQVIFPKGTETHVATVGREFLTAMVVVPRSDLVGQTVASLGFHKLPDIYLVSIDRPLVESESTRRQRVVVTPSNGRVESTEVDEYSDHQGSVMQSFVMKAITQDDALQEGDLLWFSGSAEGVASLRKIPGLSSFEAEEVKKINAKVFDRRLVQAVVSRQGDLVGKTVKDLRFRSVYGAAVISVNREGRRVHEHPGNIRLQAGDVLLLEAGPSFMAKSNENSRSFALLAEVENSAPPRLRLLIPAIIITIAMMAVYTTKLFDSLLVCALVACICMISCGIISEKEARDGINWNIYVTIATAFGISTALVNSGVADHVADFLIDIANFLHMGDAGLFGAIYFTTFLVGTVVQNNAAAALMFPIALKAATKYGADKVLMSYELMLCSSASYMTPFGYTTNLLIYGPGGYTTSDFLWFGTPLQFVMMILSTAFVVNIRPWIVSWIISIIVFVAIAAYRICLAEVALKRTTDKAAQDELDAQKGNTKK